MDDLLFEPYITHVTVQCWSCKHELILLPSDVPASISCHDFQRRAKCSACGVGWPHVYRYPRPHSKWSVR